MDKSRDPMEPTIQAILARFNGDETLAFRYCQAIANSYPTLRAEYMALAFRFGWSNPNVPKTYGRRQEAAHV